MKCSFKQDAGKVTGSCAFEGLGTSDTVGEITGDKVTLKNHAERGQVYDLTWNCTLDSAGASMTGNIAVADYSGTFYGEELAKDAAPKPLRHRASAAPGPSPATLPTMPVDMKCAFKRDDDKLSGNCAYSGLGDSPDNWHCRRRQTHIPKPCGTRATTLRYDVYGHTRRRRRFDERRDRRGGSDR